MKKEKLLTVGLYLVVGYAIALLGYCSLYFVFKKSDAYISAFGSVLSATATFTASFVAVYLFNDWKVQHNKQVINNFGLQVYELFFSFENDLSIYHQHLEELQALISSYDYEVNSTMLYVDNNKIYISNITNAMNTLKLSFNSLYSKFQAYSIVSGTLEKDATRYKKYLFDFNEINMHDDDIFYLQKNLNTWKENYQKTLELSNKIRKVEIKKLLVSLKVE